MTDGFILNLRLIVYMQKNILLILICCAGFFTANAQHLRGKVVDVADSKPLIGASVTLQNLKDSTVQYFGRSGSNGLFDITVQKADSFLLTVTYVGYQMYKEKFAFTDVTENLGNISLGRTIKEGEAVIIVTRIPPMQQKVDTLQINASQIKVNADANAEDLVKKSGAVTIENGVVKAGGEQVRKITVDGRDFFGEDAAATLRNLPAEIVDKIQVFDRASDQAQFTGIDDGNAAKSINIVTKVNMRNGQFGRVFGGYGTDNHYLAGGNMSMFKNNSRLSIVALANDVNQQNFTELDLMGVSGSNSRGGGGGRGGFGGGAAGGGGGGRGGGQGGFLVGQQPGVSKTMAIGLNYNDKWGKDVDVSASYFFNRRRNSNLESLTREYYINNGNNPFYDQTTTSSNLNTNHRFNLRLDYKIDSSNSILIAPSLNLQEYDSYNNTEGLNYYTNSKISATRNESNANRTAVNFNNSILYRHSFKKKGRTFSLNLNTGINNTNGETYTDAFSNYFLSAVTDSVQQFTDQDTKGKTLSANLSYTEPLSKNSVLQLSFNPSVNKSSSDQRRFELDQATGKYSTFDTSLSNVFDNVYTTYRGGVTFRKGDRTKNFNIGLDVQSANLSSDRTFPLTTAVNRNFFNLLPNAMLQLPLSKKSTLRLFYRTNTNAPSVTQLQDVINNNNPLLISTGNPLLKQQYSHRLGFRYQYTNAAKGLSIVLNSFGSTAQDYVANATYIAQSDSVLTPTVTLYRGSQLNKPVNLDGQWNINTFGNISMPMKFIKSNLNLNLGYVYNRTPGLINNVSSLTTATTLSTGIVVASNISQFVDFTVSYTASFNDSRNSSQTSLNNKYFSAATGVKLNLQNKTGWVLTNDVSNQTFNGLNSGFDQRYWLWNAAIAKKFMKNQKAELRLSVFDLLKQNQSIFRTVTETYLEDSRTQVLQQYFMLTFTYNLKNFGTASRSSSNNRTMDRGGMGGRPAGMGF